MRRGLLLAAVAALLIFALCSPALAQEENRGATEYCADHAASAYEYGCDGGGPRSPVCTPQQQYADDGTKGCVAAPYQYGGCTDVASCTAEAQSDQQAGSGTGTLPPASVQNVVVAAANSVSEDAPEASRALDTAEPLETGDNVALAEEGQAVAAEEDQAVSGSPPRPSEAPEEAATGGTAPRQVEVPDNAAPPAEPKQTADVAVPSEKGETAEVEGDGGSAASNAETTLEQAMVPLFALAGSTLLICGGLLARRIVG